MNCLRDYPPVIKKKSPSCNFDGISIEQKNIHITFHPSQIDGNIEKAIKEGEREPYTTICLRASRGLRMNLRVRRVTGASAMVVDFCD